MSSQPVSLRAYARHRKAAGLVGATLRAVQDAIAAGRLAASLTDDRKKIRDAALADREWELATKADHVPLTGPAAAAATARGAPNPLADARARREAAQASIREMELAERQGELVAAKDVEARLVTVFALCRTKLLSIPARARQRDPSLSGRHLVLLEALIRESLEDLAGPPAESDERRTG